MATGKISSLDISLNFNMTGGRTIYQVGKGLLDYAMERNIPSNRVIPFKCTVINWDILVGYFIRVNNNCYCDCQNTGGRSILATLVDGSYNVAHIDATVDTQT